MTSYHLDYPFATPHTHPQALEPSISKEIMTLHHDKHHQAYVTGLNAAEEKLAGLQSSEDVKGQISLQAALKFNGGGHLNHSVGTKCRAVTLDMNSARRRCAIRRTP